MMNIDQFQAYVMAESKLKTLLGLSAHFNAIPRRRRGEQPFPREQAPVQSRVQGLH